MANIIKPRLNAAPLYFNDANFYTVEGAGAAVNTRVGEAIQLPYSLLGEHGTFEWTFSIGVGSNATAKTVRAYITNSPELPSAEDVAMQLTLANTGGGVFKVIAAHAALTSPSASTYFLRIGKQYSVGAFNDMAKASGQLALNRHAALWLHLVLRADAGNGCSLQFQSVQVYPEPVNYSFN